MQLYDNTTRIPKALPCLHTFCVTCLDMLGKTTGDNDQQVKCPTCQAGFEIPRSGVKGLPTNLSVQHMLELNLHQNMKLESHTASQNMSTDEARATDGSADYMCNNHSGTKVIMVCASCSVGLCIECMKSLSDLGHNNHKLDDIESYLIGYESEVHIINKRFEELPRLVADAGKDHTHQLEHLHKCINEDIDRKVETAIEKAREWQMQQRIANTAFILGQHNYMTEAAKDIETSIENGKSIIDSITQSKSCREMPSMEQISYLTKLVSGVETDIHKYQFIDITVRAVPSLDIHVD